MSSIFDISDVQVETTAWVQNQVHQKRGGWIVGTIGSGKSHAVRAAGLGGVHVDMVPGPLLGQRFASDLARQLGSNGRTLLETARREGFAKALDVAEGIINGYPLVVDAAEQLLLEPSNLNLDEPAAALWQEDKDALRDWLVGRLDQCPTFLISRRKPGVSAHDLLQRTRARSSSAGRFRLMVGDVLGGSRASSLPSCYRTLDPPPGAPAIWQLRRSRSCR